MVYGVNDAPLVTDVQVNVRLGQNIDLNRVGERCGTYTKAGCFGTTHDVFDLRTSMLDPNIVKLIPDNIASDERLTVIRLYVPKSQNGQINDIGIVNGLYGTQGYPWYSRSGHKPIYVAPADSINFKLRAEPARLSRAERY